MKNRRQHHRAHSGVPRQWAGCSYLLCIVLLALASCSSTKHLRDDQYLMWKNKVTLINEKPMANKGELRSNLDNIIVQQPNSNFMSITAVKIPMRLWRYNRRYRKFSAMPDSLLPKSKERPVIFDSITIPRSKQNMKNYLFNQGYFYATVKDTVEYNGKRAIVHYTVNAGPNYLVNRLNYNIDDSAIAAIVKEAEFATVLKKGAEFTYSMLEEERSRLTNLINNHGYRRFSLENITFKIDTLDKSMFRVAASPFENAVNFITQSRNNKKSTLDVDIIIRKGEDTLSYNIYHLASITVYPDYKGIEDRTNPHMITRTVNGIKFKYHNEYVLPRVVYKHMFIMPGNLYSKADEERTISRLGGLGIFHYIRIEPRENRLSRDSLECSIYLNRAQKYDFSTNYEVSNGSTYTLGNSLSFNARNKNFMRGANLLTLSANGGVETNYQDELPGDIVDRFVVLTKYYGINASLDFPKFIAPVASSLFTNTNLPHTVISVGENVLHRVNYFKLINTSASFSYNWRETETKTWTLSPAFINIIKLPGKDLTKEFEDVLASNEYLRHSYKPTFIEGENISFRFDNSGKKKNRNNSYLRLGFEEAGSIMNGIKKVGIALDQLYKLNDTTYAQYTKFDFDARHYFSLRRSVFGVRFYGGIGIPYGDPWALPYIKQYYVGGPYSLRGWRARTLGPGSHGSDTMLTNTIIDRTGDIKLELNAEYRFPIMPLFAGAVKMNGALFADAGNIWLAYPDTSFAGGEIAFDKFGQDIAMDMGLGTRFEIASFLTVRVDVAMPVKKPYISTNGGWVFDGINRENLRNNEWRQKNMVLNLSIGYPF